MKKLLFGLFLLCGTAHAYNSTFAILNSSSSMQPGNPTIWVASGTVNNLNVSTETVGLLNYTTLNPAITGFSIYPATASASFPFGITFSTVVWNGQAVSTTTWLTQVSTTNLNATGTASNTTYLRGDNSWATPAGGSGGSSIYPATATATFNYGFTSTTATITNATVTYNLTAGSTTFNGNLLNWPSGTGASLNYLGTDGSGNLTWNAGTSGTISNVYNATATVGCPLGIQVSTITAYGPGGSTYNNEVYGAAAGEKLTTGASNVYVGYQAGNAATTNGKSVYIGYQAGLKATTGASAENVAIGYQAGAAITTQASDVFIGYEAGLKATTGATAGNTAVGYEALPNVTTGNSNTAVGYLSLQSATANNNTAIGFGALDGDSTGQNNTAVGYQSGYGGGGGGPSTGSNDTFIGYNSMAGSAGITNSTAIGYLAQVNVSSAIVLGAINGVNGYTGQDTYVGIGTSSPTTLLHISSGTVTIDGNVSPAIAIKGSGAPPDNEALCLLNGQLGHCTGGTLVSCSCSVP